MSEYFELTVLGNSNGVHNHGSDVPDCSQGFMELGSGNLQEILQENIPPVTSVLTDLPSHSATSDTPAAVLSTQDVYKHLNSVAHQFRTNLKELLTNDLRGQEYLHALTNVGKNNTSLMSSILIDSELRNNPDKGNLYCFYY